MAENTAQETSRFNIAYAGRSQQNSYDTYEAGMNQMDSIMFSELETKNMAFKSLPVVLIDLVGLDRVLTFVSGSFELVSRTFGSIVTVAMSTPIVLSKQGLLGFEFPSGATDSVEVELQQFMNGAPIDADVIIIGHVNDDYTITWWNANTLLLGVSSELFAPTMSASLSQVKVSAADTTADYLESKISAGTGITITKLTPGADETLEISSTAATLWDRTLGTPNFVKPFNNGDHVRSYTGGAYSDLGNNNLTFSASGAIAATGANDLTFAAQGGAAIALNTALDPVLVGFTKASIIGALNELKAEGWTRVTGTPNYVKPGTNGDAVRTYDAGGTIYSELAYDYLKIEGAVDETAALVSILQTPIGTDVTNTLVNVVMAGANWLDDWTTACGIRIETPQGVKAAAVTDGTTDLLSMGIADPYMFPYIADYSLSDVTSTLVHFDRATESSGAQAVVFSTGGAANWDFYMGSVWNVDMVAGERKFAILANLAAGIEVIPMMTIKVGDKGGTPTIRGGFGNFEPKALIHFGPGIETPVSITPDMLFYEELEAEFADAVSFYDTVYVGSSGLTVDGEVVIANSSRLLQTSVSNTLFSTFETRRARASDTAVQNGDVLADWIIGGCIGGTSYNMGARIRYVVNAVPSGGMPTTMEIWTGQNGDTSLHKRLEVSSTGIHSYYSATFSDDAYVIFGGTADVATDSRIGYNTAHTGTVNALSAYLNTNSRIFYIGERGDETADYALSQQTDPTLVIQASDATKPGYGLMISYNAITGRTMTAAGAPPNLTVKAGSAFAGSNSNGASLYIAGGRKDGSGTEGSVYVQVAGTTRLTFDGTDGTATFRESATGQVIIDAYSTAHTGTTGCLYLPFNGGPDCIGIRTVAYSKNPGLLTGEILYAHKTTVVGNSSDAGSAVLVGIRLATDGTSAAAKRSIWIDDDFPIVLGTDADTRIVWSSAQTAHATVIGLGTDSRVLILCEKGDESQNFGLASQTDPLLAIQAADAGNPGYGLLLNYNSIKGRTMTTDVAPPDLTIQAGSAFASSNDDGADLYLAGGRKDGFGVEGSVYLQTAGATRMQVQDSELTMSVDINMNANDIVLNTTTGTKIGTSASQKLGFFNATPVSQRLRSSYNNWAAFGDVVNALVDLGLFDAP